MSLQLIAGASLQLAGRCASCRGTGSGCCTWLFHIKQKYCIHQHAFLSPNIQHSTFHHPPGADGPPLSPERETCFILSVNQLSHAYFLTKWKKCNIVSLFLQIHIVESTIPRRSSVPLSLQKGAAYGMLPICKAFVCLPFYKRLFHIPLQSPWGLHNPMSPGSYRPENDNTILTDL